MADGRNLLDAAALWLEAGWHPIPTTGVDGKTPAIDGVTGYDGVDLTPDQLPEAFSKPGVVGLGIRMPAGVLGIDVDGYRGKLGPETIMAMTRELGVELPFAPMISGRLDGRSGIRFYRVPEGLDWTADALNEQGGGVDLIHRGYRHAKAWPSVHHETGLTLGRLDVQPGELVGEDDGGEPWLLPPPDELPDLPPEWVGALTMRRARTDSREAVEWVNDRGMDECWGPAVLTAWAGWSANRGSRHDTMRDVQVRLVRLDSLGQPGSTAALIRLHDEYVAAVGGERDAEGEWDRALRGAVAKVATSESFLEQGRRLVASVFRRYQDEYDTAHCQVLPDGQVVKITTSLPEAFWMARPVLGQIRQAAHNRRRSADAVLGAVLARLGGMIPPTYRLPPEVGAPSTLSMYVALVGPSGTGKSTSVSIARALLPIPTAHLDTVVEHALGSGEGLIELYMGEQDSGEVNSKGNPIMERAQIRHGAVLMLDEGQALAEMGGRSGSTMLSTLRTMWTGAMVGQANVKDNKRKLAEGGYALGFVVGIQPALGADLLSDTAAGTPQRFLWLQTRDATVPHRAERPPWPGPITLRLPQLPRDGRVRPELELAPEVVELLDWEAVETVRGSLTVAPMDSHRNLLILKAAGLLALLDGRLNLTMDDWRLATVLVDTSTAVRESMEDTLKVEAEHKEAVADQREARRAKARVEAEVETVEVLAHRNLERAAATVARAVHSKGPMTVGYARRTLRGPVRKELSMDQVVAVAVERGWIVEVGDKLEAGPEAP